MNFNTDKPTRTALYLVDRGMQGKYYRWYDADADQWGLCGVDMQEALDNKTNSAVGFFPWAGPLTGPAFNPNKPITVVTDEPAPKAPKATKAPKAPKVKMAKQRTVTVAAPKAPKATKAKAAVFPDGTVWFRADRQKWVAMMHGKQEAARPTADACLKFLAKKYGVTGNVINHVVEE